jgi:hypothetical protein
MFDKPTSEENKEEDTLACRVREREREIERGRERERKK